jgi:hypothetical protein
MILCAQVDSVIVQLSDTCITLTGFLARRHIVLSNMLTKLRGVEISPQRIVSTLPAHKIYATVLFPVARIVLERDAMLAAPVAE